MDHSDSSRDFIVCIYLSASLFIVEILVNWWHLEAQSCDKLQHFLWCKRHVVSKQRLWHAVNGIKRLQRSDDRKHCFVIKLKDERKIREVVNDQQKVAFKQCKDVSTTFVKLTNWNGMWHEHLEHLLLAISATCPATLWTRFSSKVANFNPQQNLHLSPPKWAIPLEFRRELWCRKTRVPELSCGIICVILHLAVLIQ